MYLSDKLTDIHTLNKIVIVGKQDEKTNSIKQII